MLQIAFLAEFPGTLYPGQLEPGRSTTRKNPQLGAALKEKGNAAYGKGDMAATLARYNQVTVHSSQFSAGWCDRRCSTWGRRRG